MNPEREYQVRLRACARACYDNCPGCLATFESLVELGKSIGKSFDEVDREVFALQSTFREPHLVTDFATHSDKMGCEGESSEEPGCRRC